MNVREAGGLLRASLREFAQDKCPKQAAALAYYTLFAIGPLLMLAIGVAALAFGAEAAREAVLAQFVALLGETGGEGIAALIAGADRERVGIVGTVVGLVVLLVTAGAVFAQLKEALNRVWEVEAKDVQGWKAKVWRAVRKNMLSFAGVLGTGFLLLVSLVVSAAIAAMGDYLVEAFPGAELLLQTVNFLVSFVVVALVFALLFKFLPDARIAWRDVLLGAAITSALFVIGQFALGYYLGGGPLSSRFGVAGAFAIVLVWVYYSSMILFLGAEITQVYANRHGSRVRTGRDAEPLRDAVSKKQASPEREGTRKA